MKTQRIYVVMLAAAMFATRILAAPAAAAPGKVVGLESVTRMVSDLDRSVAFYQALGFVLDPAVPSQWNQDPTLERLYGAQGFQTRTVRMYVINSSSGQRFPLFLRELKGIERANLSQHTAWDTASSHFGLVVPDANALWSRLKANHMLHARSWGGELIAPPGQTKGMLAYLTDPDGLDIEIIDQRPATPAENGRPARPALLPGVTHTGLIVLDSAKAKAFYGTLLGGQLVSQESPWHKGDFYDSAVGGHGNILRFFNESFPDAAAVSQARLNVELVEYQNRREPPRPARITDIGVGYVVFGVEDLDALLARARSAGAQVVSDAVVTMKSGSHAVILRDPDVGGFVQLIEHPQKQAASRIAGGAG